MKYWFIHHLHFLIALDLFLHAAIITLGFLALYWGFAFIKAVKNHTNANRTSTTISYAMLPLVGFIIYCAIHSAIECFVQYHTWWNR
jgi:hypothetical protein